MDTEIKSIEQIHELINKEIESLPFSGYPSNLYDPIAYMMHQNGKRLRPALALIACNMFGGDLKKILRPAIGIEIFHNFTLVHDDIMDQSPIRRNHETVYRKWGTNVAILVGDTMFALAYEFLIQTDEGFLGEILRLFNKTAIQVCEGQQLDIEFENRTDVSIDEYIEMIREKTAVLLGTSLMTGAIVARTPKQQAEQLYQMGIKMGLA
ncbi:MAG: polyprenyl synthetase family protein, partial [Bacteroidales bacterium]|nr:polyprenyl synthetase family protein [Bacteroidales bacterium]